MKYMGSKARIAKDIIPIITKDRLNGQYVVDAFCGGCNFLDKVDGNRIGNDLNRYLIAMWKCLAKGVNFPKTINKEMYSLWRNFYHETKNLDTAYVDEKLLHYGTCGWVGFMGSFNGRFYDGGYSGHNVKGKTGKVRDYISEQINNTMSQVPSIKDVQFVSFSYEELKVPNSSIIYCDPPYRDTKQYDLSKNFDYDKFYKWCLHMADIGHKVFISEYSMPCDFVCVWEKEVTNAMNPVLTKSTVERLFIPKNQI